MKTILAPIDFSDNTKPVIAQAAALARAMEARLVLLNAIQPVPASAREFGFAEAIGKIAAAAVDNAKRKLTHIQEQLRDAWITVSTLTAIGSPGATILARSRELSADYIVIGSHGHGALYDLIVGSTTSRVLKEATCPVLVIPHGVTTNGLAAALNLEPADARGVTPKHPPARPRPLNRRQNPCSS
jgi:nucleotide-binding universal stress UspA family protein